MGLREGLQEYKVAHQAVGEGAAVSDADAVNSLVIEGKFTSLDKGAIFTKLYMEIDIYRVTDHALVKTIATHDQAVSHGAVKNLAEVEGEKVSETIVWALRKVSLSSIPLGPPVPRPAAPAPASAKVVAAPPVFASIQISSNPAGAEITIDGNDAGNTPSLIKLRPGTHSIRITKDGYTPWERSIDTGAGEARTIAADLEKTGQ